jgi:hypothetical protein
MPNTWRIVLVTEVEGDTTTAHDRATQAAHDAESAGSIVLASHVERVIIIDADDPSTCTYGNDGSATPTCSNPDHDHGAPGAAFCDRCFSTGHSTADHDADPSTF